MQEGVLLFVYFRGKSSTGKSPFREVFGRIKELRSLCREDLPVLALTATADVDMSELIISSVGLSKNVKIISTCANRPNIRLSVVTIPKKNISCLYWIIEGLREYGVDAPKVIIYCRSVTLVGWLYEQLLVVLGNMLMPIKILINLSHLLECTTLKLWLKIKKMYSTV